MQLERPIRIFVSYRHEDSEFVATALCERLKTMFGSSNVFMDVDSIPAGRNFRQHLQSAVLGSDVVLALIGDRWLDVRDAAGRRRLDQPSDWVRIELESALARDIPVIPVMIGTAHLPSAEQLPESLQELAYRQTVQLRSGRDFSKDAEGLGRDILRTAKPGCVDVGPSHSARDVEPMRPRVKLALVGLLVAVLLVLPVVGLTIVFRNRIADTARDMWDNVMGEGTPNPW